jgi:hypothetical protein
MSAKSKFTDDGIKEILSLRAMGMSFRKIGDRFCVGHTIIRNICIKLVRNLAHDEELRRTWKLLALSSPS